MASIGTRPGRSLIARPTPTDVAGPFRLTSIVPVKDTGDIELIGGIQYETDGCGETYNAVDFDEYEDCIRTAAKDFTEGLDYVESLDLDLALLATVKCRPGGLGGGSTADFEARAQRRLARVESRYLEDKLWAEIGTNGTTSTGGTGAEATIAALLGAHIDDVNSPILHLSVKNAIMVAHRLDDYANVLGIRVVVSPGYADNRIALTGQVNIWGGAVQTHAVPSLVDNFILGLAERQYIMSIECEPYYAAVA